MKSTALFFLLTASLVLFDVPATEASNVPAATGSATVKAKEETFFKRRRKGPRRKRGFMWGLFKKKDCGCPKF
jgi:hypothetical protein